MGLNEFDQKYFLALQRMPGDTIFIDISKLSIAHGFNSTVLAELDAFTMSYTTTEIVDAIHDANIVDPMYLNGTLVIQDNEKHNPLKVIDKDYVGRFNIESFLKEKASNKAVLNNIAYKLGTLVDDSVVVDCFKSAARMNNFDLVFQILFSLPYLVQRKFMIYLIDMYHKEEEKRGKTNYELIRDKAA